MNERYVDQRELAEIMGVSVTTIYRLTREGMPSVTWAKRTRRYLPSEAIEWAKRRSLPQRHLTSLKGGSA